MLRKLTLFSLALFGSVLLKGQTPASSGQCGTGAPPQQWDQWFNKAVEDWLKLNQNNKTTEVTHEIPVIIHLIHFGEALGTYPNIDSNQIKSQMAALNADFAGTGYNVNKIPSVFSNALAHTGIKFCMATQNPQGGVLTERGVQRLNAQTNTWPNPKLITIPIKDYIELYAKPSTMWDPIRYLNIWISDKPASQSMRGYATYPGGTSLVGIPGGSEIGTVNNDGIWIWTAAFGTVGAVTAPWDKGRTLTHEVGHWLGLRHTWGDGNCYPDYCNDTPPSKMENTGCFTHPAFINRCGVSQSPVGEMFMNFMDGTEDTCKYMFTVDQNIRMQTALSQCNFRNALGTHNICVPSLTPPSAAVAGFNFNSPPCVGAPFTPFNTSSGSPPPTYIWSSNPPMVFNPAPSVANPAISASSPGSYTLTLIATNSITSSTYTMALNNIGACPFVSTCIDSLTMLKGTDTLSLYKAPTNTLIIGCQGTNAGYLTGTNCYNDRELAQFFPPSSYTGVPTPQIVSAIVLFDSLHTKQGPLTINPSITCRIYGGNVTSGPGAQLGFSSVGFSSVTSTSGTNQVQFMGDPTYISASRITPFRFDFPTPVMVNNNASGFYVSVDLPYFSPSDTLRIFSTRKAATSLDSNAWFLNNLNNWRTFRTFRNAKIQLGIMPILTCSPLTGLEENIQSLANSVNVVPNPSNGIFQLVFTLPKTQSMNLRITNAIGQEITSARLYNIVNSMYQVDLSSKSDGVYFIEVFNGTEKVVKKLIVSH